MVYFGCRTRSGSIYACIWLEWTEKAKRTNRIFLWKRKSSTKMGKLAPAVNTLGIRLRVRDPPSPWSLLLGRIFHLFCSFVASRLGRRQERKARQLKYHTERGKGRRRRRRRRWVEGEREARMERFHHRRKGTSGSRKRPGWPEFRPSDVSQIEDNHFGTCKLVVGLRKCPSGQGRRVSSKATNV